MKYLVLFFAALLVIFTAGCSTTGSAPGAYTLSGTIYSYDYRSSASYSDNSKLNTIIVAGATIEAIGPSGTKTALTDSSGAFSISGLQTGTYRLIITKSGFVRYAETVTISAAELGTATSRYYSAHLDPRPSVDYCSVSPEAIVPTSTTTFEIRFSKPMDTTTIVPLLYLAGLRASGVNASNVEESVTWTWDSTNTALTVTAPNALRPDAIYYLGIIHPSRGSGYFIKGADGNYAYFFYSSYFVNSGTSSPLGGTYMFLPFKTAASTSEAPGQPPILYVRDSSGSSELDYGDFHYYYNGGVYLSWEAVAGANGYYIYAQINGGKSQLVKSSLNPLAQITVNDLDNAIEDFERLGGSSATYPVAPGLPWPYLGAGVTLEVRAYNANGQGASSPSALARDAKAPVIAYVTEISSSEKKLYYLEPLEPAIAENIANYSVAGQVVSSAVLSNSFSSPSSTYITLTLVPGATSGTIETSGLTDISGNVKASDSIAF
ncbi:hypothetical protein A2311_02330 [candidate division WOR-1 bacterium RIFOXYB2_FULL_48_7]|uniref:SbsA Ig-like domain-containing protein n=1 Tax=candidate division WOR-1 bacterium RIFOXYB2_FULL_48_7 TaxID=1802583 RepID=A0A1F4TUS1_UNCSA|nr:MAG: hypothetical protein A2311_02330 [candidate division WOR-1 bacterium RIFOXYB2_FULL_48_7]